MYKYLLRKSSKNGFTFISEAQVKNIERPILDMEQPILDMEHLTCFMGGLLGLGVHFMSQLENSHEYKERIERDMETAKAVTYTCYQMYASTKTGLGSDKVLFVEHKANLRGAQVSSDIFEIQSSGKKYILRPEVVESLYIMHKLTRDPIYREWGKSDDYLADSFFICTFLPPFERFFLMALFISRMGDISGDRKELQNIVWIWILQ